MSRETKLESQSMQHDRSPSLHPYRGKQQPKRPAEHTLKRGVSCENFSRSMARDCCVGKFAGLISRRGEPRDTAKRRVAQLTRSFPGASTRGSSRLLRAAKGRAASPSQGKRPLIKLSRPTLASRFFIGSGRRMSGR